MELGYVYDGNYSTCYKIEELDFINHSGEV